MRNKENNIFFSSEQVGIAAFFGSLIAGAILLASNYKKVNNFVAARIVLICGGVFTLCIITMIVLIHIGSLFGISIPIVSYVLSKQLAKYFQGNIYDENIKSGGKTASDWKVIGIGLLWCGIILVLLIFLTLLLSPKSVHYNNLGLAYAKQGNFTEAILDFTKAIEINPNDAAAYNNRGNSYDKQGNLIQSMSDFTKAIEINPKYAEAYNNRGTAYIKQGNLTKAITDYTRAIEINSNDVIASAYSNRAAAYYIEKEYDNAWADVHKAEGLGYQLNPKLLEALKSSSGRDQ